MPALSEISSMIKALLPTRQIDIGYITRKLDALKKDDVNLKELAGFLAQHLKLDYFAFYIDGRLYGSKNLGSDEEALKKLKKLKAPFGQVLLGRPTSGHSLERHELIEIEMVVNLCDLIISGSDSL